MRASRLLYLSHVAAKSKEIFMARKIGLRRIGDSKAGKANTARYEKREVVTKAKPEPVKKKSLFK